MPASGIWHPGLPRASALARIARVLTSLEYRHLRAFVTLADELHFHNAAWRLHISQPTLSQTLRQLELTLGIKLFERSTRRVVLTPAGRAMLEQARSAMAAFEGVLLRASQVSRGQAGELAVGYEVTTGLDFIPQVLREFSDASPEVSVTLAEFDFAAPAAGLDTGESDVAFLRPPVDCDGLELLTLHVEPRVVCVTVSHRFSDRASVSVAEVLPEPIIAAPTPGVWRDYWILAEHRNGIEANVVLEAATCDSELQAVAAGRGIIVTSGTYERYYCRPGVCYVPIDDLPPCEIALAWPTDSQHPALSRFIGAARTVVDYSAAGAG
jgi:DNA-binding transcriptional LysR family regulator